jgi:hypothetical protein
VNKNAFFPAQVPYQVARTPEHTSLHCLFQLTTVAGKIAIVFLILSVMANNRSEPTSFKMVSNTVVVQNRENTIKSRWVFFMHTAIFFF